VSENITPGTTTVTQATGTNLHTVVDSGTVTANAGTNLNTSLLALEAGNLALIKADVDKIPAQGQALAAASTPVVLTAAQVTTLTPPAAITGFALDATVGLAQGSTTAGQKGPLVQGAVTTAAPAYTTAQTDPLSLTTAGGLRSDIASYGGTATTLGQKAMASSVPVVMASDFLQADTTAAFVAINGLNVAVTIALQGQTGASAQLLGGTLAGTVVGEYSLDGGTNWGAAVLYTGVGGYSLNLTIGAGITLGLSMMLPAGTSHARIRCSVFTSGTTNISMRATSVAPANYVRAMGRPAFTATYRLTARPYALSNAFGAAGIKQFATIYHAATAVKILKILKATLWLKSNTAAATVLVELRKLSATTAPATGNPAITPTTHAGATVVESTCLALPTTAGSESNANAGWGGQEIALGVTGAGSAANPIPQTPPIVLYQKSTELEELVPQINAGTAGGFAVMIDASILTTITATAEIIFTEE